MKKVLLITLARKIFYYPDASRGWKPFALSATKELVEQESIVSAVKNILGRK